MLELRVMYGEERSEVGGILERVDQTVETRGKRKMNRLGSWFFCSHGVVRLTFNPNTIGPD